MTASFWRSGFDSIPYASEMSSPRAIVQIFLTGSRILGKAFLEAGRQAVKNAKHNPNAAVAGEASVSGANAGSPSDQLTRLHRLTLDEAQLILNVKRGDTLEAVMKNYEHLFKVNSPPAKPAKAETPAKGKVTVQAYSHYLQSKVVCARERLEAEFKLAEEAVKQEPPSETPSTPPPPSSPSSSS